ncbi:MAG: hypothetical protein LW860_11010 [Xanthomonadaceae bacterium]|jgi:hypothetical protein|nr:hypothetical protein [Xanthomonadaceae bacterium]
MTRWRAAGAHFVISAVVAVAVVALLLLVWYPGPLYEAGGGERLTFILVAIDIVVGPILTLLVFRAGKPGMKFDLTVIALLQVAFLAYGLSVISAARPAYVVFAIDRFVAVGANQLADHRLAEAVRPEFGRRPWTGPVWVSAERPQDPDEADRVMSSFLTGDGDLERFPKFYVPYAEQAAQAGRKAKPLAELKGKPGEAAELERVRAAFPGTDVGWLPLVARSRDMTVILRRDSGEVLEIVRVDPW